MLFRSERYLRAHGHRAIKELELRQPEWREDPLPVIHSLQVSLRQRDSGSTTPRPTESVGAKPSRGVALLARMARQAVRSREETKSGLVAATTRFKEAYRTSSRANPPGRGRPRIAGEPRTGHRGGPHRAHDR